MSQFDQLSGREILIGVCGGVAAYKVAELTSLLVQSGAKVSVTMTNAAQQFIGKTTFEALSGRPVVTELFDPKEHYLGEHIGLAKRADLYVIAPATAHLLARLAHGLADDLVTTLALAVTCPVLLAPAMNNEMWSKPAVERNVDQLRCDGLNFIGPEDGWLSCQNVGPGRMSSAIQIATRIDELLSTHN